MQRVVKPKTRRGKRWLENREPKLIENNKTALLMRASTCSQMVIQCLKDLTLLKKPDAVFFSRKKEIRPFEDMSYVEFISSKQDASLFAFGSHNKKRPNNLILGRMYDSHLLDMVELGIESFKGLSEFKVPKISSDTKPCLLFLGEPFDTQHDYQRIKSLFIDFFRGRIVNGIHLAGLEHVLLFTAVDGKIHIRSYRIVMKKSGSKIPRIELDEIGPSIDLTVRRTKLASNDLYKAATKRPRELKAKKVKNISKDKFGSKLGRVHMQKQEIDKLQTRKLKGLKKSLEQQKLDRKTKLLKRKQSAKTTVNDNARPGTGDVIIKSSDLF